MELIGLSSWAKPPRLVGRILEHQPSNGDLIVIVKLGEFALPISVGIVPALGAAQIQPQAEFSPRGAL